MKKFCTVLMTGKVVKYTSVHKNPVMDKVVKERERVNSAVIFCVASSILQWLCVHQSVCFAPGTLNSPQCNLIGAISVFHKTGKN